MLRNLFRRGRVERELDDEMRAHLEMLADEKVAAGELAHPLRDRVPVRGSPGEGAQDEHVQRALDQVDVLVSHRNSP